MTRDALYHDLPEISVRVSSRTAEAVGSVKSSGIRENTDTCKFAIEHPFFANCWPFACSLWKR
eukprot:1143825-Karenia_brevis.AAC.1